jgi:malonyl CoA-acyl carrier protein transacylase/acyl carrier protein
MPPVLRIIGRGVNGPLNAFWARTTMTASNQSAFLLPGQGAYQPGALAAAGRTSAVIDDTLQEVDSISGAHFGTSVSDLLLDPDASSLTTLLQEDPDTLQMAIYAASVATHRLLEARSVYASILIGHSFGEIAALACGGAFSVREGAQIVAQRCLALKPAAGLGYMAAVGASAQRCTAIIEALDAPWLAVAVENGSSQTVVSGPTAAMDRMAAVTQTLGLSFIRLASPYPFHSPQLEQAAQAFQSAIAGFQRQPLRVPVYSPILQRAYHDQDDLGAALASHLTRPVRFTDAIRRPANAWAHASMAFVEMGASSALVKLVRQILGDPRIPAFAPFAPSAPVDALEATVNALRSNGSADSSADRGPEPDRTPAPAMSIATAKKTAPARSVGNALTRAQLQRDIVELFAQSMEYPPEVFTDDVALEAELGIDSVKQMELLGKLELQYRLPPRPEDFRLSEYGTLRKIADFVFDAIGGDAPVDQVLTADAAMGVSASAEPTSMPVARNFAAEFPRLTRSALQDQIVALFAQAMEYPPEVFTDDVALEAELGIDSVKQMELLGKLELQYRLPPRPEDFRLSDYGTLRKINDFVYEAIGADATETSVSADDAATPTAVAIELTPMPARKEPASGAQATKAAQLTRAGLQEQIVALFAQAMEYPPEVFTDDVALEAELGIDSVKQMELLGKLEAQYRLPPRPEDFRLSDYGTLCKIADFVYHAINAAEQPIRGRDPLYAVG